MSKPLGRLPSPDEIPEEHRPDAQSPGPESQTPSPMACGCKERGPVHADYLDFQPDSVEIEMRPTPKAVRWTAYGMVLFLLAAIAWSIIAKVDRVVTTRGKLVATAKTIVVAPLNTSVIKEFLVREGQVVEADEPLVILDPTFTQADADQLRARRQSFAAELVRLRCELQGMLFPDSAPDCTAEELDLQRALFATRQEEYASRLESMDQELASLAARTTTLEDERAQAQRRLGVARELTEMYGQVMEDGASSRVEYLNAQQSVLGLENEVERLGNQLQETVEETRRVAAEREAFVSNWDAEVSRRLVELEREAAELDRELDKADRLNQLDVLRSPSRAVVLELGSFSVGSVVDRAQTVLTLAPLDEQLVAEVDIAPQDIGFVREGDEVRIKLDAFPFQKHGTVQGRVQFLSEGVFEQGGQFAGQFLYHGRLELTEVALRSVPEDFRLIPGMTLTAEIKVGQRRVISYFLYPIIRALDETMREP